MRSPPDVPDKRSGSANGRIASQGEGFNFLTHLGATVVALPAAIVMVVLAALGGDPWKVTSVSIYGATLVLLYSASTLYHGVPKGSGTLLRKLDHESIYLLIAGSYTPFCLVTLRGPWGWTLFATVWILALIGAVQELIPARQGRARVPSMVIYVTMGWAALAATVPLVGALGPAGFAWVAFGGALYTCGIVFYALGTRLGWAHGVWHLFVIAGSAVHYFAILRYVL